MDEQIWTFLITYGFVAADDDGLNNLFATLTKGHKVDRPIQAWLEMLPLSPRQGIRGTSESNSEIDLMIGDIGLRDHTLSGVEYREPAGREGSVCFVEAKWLADIATGTKHDRCRNQMARVVETALTFQGTTNQITCWPKQVHFTLLTPRTLKYWNCAGGGSRLYHYKFREYDQSRNALLADIESASIPRRNSLGWRYPSLDDRIDNLFLHWVCYEDLLLVMPDSPYKSALLDAISQQPTNLLQLT